MKKNHIIALIVLLTAASWFTGLDRYSIAYINDSLSEAGIAYASARGINALVSMFQTTEVGINVGMSGSLGIGEILDPLNDLIERFSDVMSLVIGSLMLQRILFTIVSKTIFTIVLSVLGVVTTLCIFLKSERYSNLSFKLFITFATMKYAIVVILILNSAFSSAFLSDQIESGNTKLQENGEEFSAMSGDQGNNPYLEQLNIETQEKISQKETLEEELFKINQSIAQKNTAWYSAGDSEYKALKRKQELTESKIEELESQIKALDNEINDKTTGLKKKLEELTTFLTPSIIAKKVSEMIDNIFELLTLFVLQTVLLPLLFLFGIKYAFKEVWGINIQDIVRKGNRTIPAKELE